MRVWVDEAVVGRTAASQAPKRFLANQWILEGRSYVEIAAELACSLKFLYRHFGQRRSARRVPVRSPWRLSPAGREEISCDLQAGAAYRAIAARHKRSTSTISREVNANGGRLKYHGRRADERATSRMVRPRAEAG